MLCSFGHFGIYNTNMIAKKCYIFANFIKDNYL